MTQVSPGKEIDVLKLWSVLLVAPGDDWLNKFLAGVELSSAALSARKSTKSLLYWEGGEGSAATSQ